jgi:hypothetical protein|tara:strand:+ start:40 stop:192 length:153 start_codon:yes stop_codon:yes gene_type:complete
MSKISKNPSSIPIEILVPGSIMPNIFGLKAITQIKLKYDVTVSTVKGIDI